MRSGSAVASPSVVLTVAGLSVLGWPSVAHAHGIERIAGPIALSGLIVGVVGGLAACAFGWKPRVAIVWLVLAYVVVASVSAFVGDVRQRGHFSLQSLLEGLPAAPLFFAILGGLPLLVGFATTVGVHQWLFRLRHR